MKVKVGKPCRQVTDKEAINELRSNPPRWMNAEEAAKYSGLKVRTIRAYKKKYKDFPAYQLSPRSEMRINTEELDEWYKKQSAEVARKAILEEATR